MTKSQIFMMISIVVYLGAMVWIGVIYAKKTKNVGDFYLGGRSLGPYVTAMSAEASDMSSYLLMGLPGLALLSGVAEVGWTVIGLALGTYLNWVIVAKKLRHYSAEIGAITIPDYFSLRYKDKSKILMAVSALIIIIFFVPYTASGFAACGKLFATMFSMDYHIAMVISAIVIVGYTSLGGFNAASMTDFIQSIIMTVALVIVLVFGIQQAGGWDQVMQNAKALDGYLDFFKGYNPETNSAGSYSVLSVISTLAWGLGYFGMPHILLRFMAIEDPNKIKVSRRVATIWAVISMAIAVLIGIAGMAMIKNGKLPQLEDSETVIVNISNLLSQFGVVPALLAGVIIAGILASTMSTADSQLLAASSSASENIMGSFFKLKLSEKAQMNVARATLLIISLIGVFIAWDSDNSVFSIVSFAWAGFGASFGPLVLLSLFWKRSNRHGALAGMIVGGVMVFVWKYGIAKLGGAFEIYELLPAFLCGLVVNVVVSLVTPAPEKEIVDSFEKVKKLK